MIDLRHSRPFKQVVIAVYWVALAVCLLSFASAFFAKDLSFRWAVGLGFFLASVLFGWRLWLYRRALGVAGPAPSVRRIFLVIVPLGVLALGGLIAAMLGLVWVLIGTWIILAPNSIETIPVGPAGTDAGPLGALVPITLGLLVAVLGIAMTLPLFRVLLRRPSPTETVENAANLREPPSA